MSDVTPAAPVGAPIGFFPFRIPTYNNIQPFTYKAGQTYLDKLEDIQDWLVKYLTPYIDGTISDYVDAFNEALTEFNKGSIAFQAWVLEQKGIFEGKAEEFQTLVDQQTAAFNTMAETAMATITAKVGAAEAARVAAEGARDLAQQWAANTQVLQDTAVTNLVNDSSTTSRGALDKLYPSLLDIYVWSYASLPAGAGPGGVTIDRTAAPNVRRNTNAKASEAYIAIGHNALGQATRARNCIAIGPEAIGVGNPGFGNLAMGTWALRHVQGVSEFAADMAGSRNVGIGSLAGAFVSSGFRNTFVGRDSGQSVTSGARNTGVGYRALTAGKAPIALSGAIENQYPAGGSDNVAFGDSSATMVLGNSNTALGAYAGASFGLSNLNTFAGYRAGYSLGSDISENGKVINYPAKTGTYQVNGQLVTVTANAHGASVGGMVGVTFTTGELSAVTSEMQWLKVTSITDPNTFVLTVPGIAAQSGGGNATLNQVETTQSAEVVGANTIIGAQANDSSKRSGGYNTLVGLESGKYLEGSSNTFVGGRSGYNMVKGDSNTFVGYNAGRANGSGGAVDNVQNSTAIGAGSIVTGSNQVQLGGSDTTPYAYTNLQIRSDRRDKANIEPSSLGLEWVDQLRPVQWKRAPRESDTVGTRLHFGFIAQEVGELCKRTGVDFAGWQDHSVDGGDDVQTLALAEMIGPMVKAIQEISERLDKAGL